MATDPARTYPSELPVLALRETVVFPLTLQPLAITRQLSIESINHALASDRLLFLALQTDGPYRLVRHPLYLGWMLIVLGAAHMTGDRLAFAVITSLYLVIAIPWEERSLERTFGDAYRRYQVDVRWRAIPYVF